MDDIESDEEIMPPAKPPKRRNRAGGSSRHTAQDSLNRDPIWAELGAFRCPRCGLTTSDESLYNCHTCSTRRSASCHSTGSSTVSAHQSPGAVNVVSLASSSSVLHSSPSSVSPGSSADACRTSSVTSSAGRFAHHGRSTASVTAPQFSQPVSHVSTPSASVLPRASAVTVSAVPAGLSVSARSSGVSSASLPLNFAPARASGNGTPSAAMPQNLTTAPVRSSGTPSAASPPSLTTTSAGTSTVCVSSASTTAPVRSPAVPSCSLPLDTATAVSSAAVNVSTAITNGSELTETGWVLYYQETKDLCCQTCKFTLNEAHCEALFLEHLVCHINTLPYNCLYCCEKFATRTVYSQHCHSAHPGKRLRCKLRNIGEGRRIIEQARKTGRADFPLKHRHCYIPKTIGNERGSTAQAHRTAPARHPASSSVASENVSSAAASSGILKMSSLPLTSSAGDSTQVSQTQQSSSSSLASTEVSSNALTTPSSNSVDVSSPSVADEPKAGGSEEVSTALPVILSCEGNYTAHEEGEATVASPDQSISQTPHQPPHCSVEPISPPSQLQPRPANFSSAAFSQQRLPVSYPATYSMFSAPSHSQASSTVFPSAARGGNPFIGSVRPPVSLPVDAAANVLTPLGLRGYQPLVALGPFSFTHPPALQSGGGMQIRAVLTQPNIRQRQTFVNCSVADVRNFTSLCPQTRPQAYALEQQRVGLLGTHVVQAPQAGQHRMPNPVFQQGTYSPQRLPSQQCSVAASRTSGLLPHYPPIHPSSAPISGSPAPLSNPADLSTHAHLQSVPQSGAAVTRNDPSVAQSHVGARADLTGAGNALADNKSSVASGSGLQISVGFGTPASAAIVKQEAPETCVNAGPLGSTPAMATSTASSTPTPSAAVTMHPSPSVSPLLSAFNGSAGDMPKYIRRNETFICLLCKRKIETENAMYAHVWDHQHPGGKHCSSCSVSDGNTVCLRTKAEVENIPSKANPSILNLLPEAGRVKFQKLFRVDSAKAVPVGDGGNRASPSVTGENTSASVENLAATNNEQSEVGEMGVACPPLLASTESGSENITYPQPQSEETSEAEKQSRSEDTAVAPEFSGDGNCDTADSTHSSTANPAAAFAQSPRPSAAAAGNESETGKSDSVVPGPAPPHETESVLAPPTSPAARSESQEPQERVEPPSHHADGPADTGENTEHASTSSSSADLPNPSSQPETDAEPVNTMPSSPAVEIESEVTGLQELGKAAEEPQEVDPEKEPDVQNPLPEEPEPVGALGDDGQKSEPRQEEKSRECTGGEEAAEEPAAVDLNAMFYACSLCSYRCCMPIDFTMHLSSEHHEAEVFICHHCNYHGRYHTDLTNHIFHHTSGPPEMFLCPNCSYKTNSLKVLGQHITAEHFSASIFRCQICKTAFDRQQDLMAHLQENSQTLFGCSRCSARFLTKDAIKQHCQIEHSGTRAYRVVKMVLCLDRKQNNYQPPTLDGDGSPSTAPEETTDATDIGNVVSLHSTSSQVASSTASVVSTSPSSVVSGSQVHPAGSITPTVSVEPSVPSSVSGETLGKDTDAGMSSAVPSLPVSLAASLGLMAQPTCSTTVITCAPKAEGEADITVRSPAMPVSAVTPPPPPAVHQGQAAPLEPLPGLEVGDVTAEVPDREVPEKSLENDEKLWNLLGTAELHQAMRGCLYQDNGPSDYVCLICDRLFTSQKLIHGHLFDDHGRVPLVACSYCERTAVSRKTIRRHLSQEHGGSSKVVLFVRVDKMDLLNELTDCRSTDDPFHQFKLVCNGITQAFEQIKTKQQSLASQELHPKITEHPHESETSATEDTLPPRTAQQESVCPVLGEIPENVDQDKNTKDLEKGRSVPPFSHKEDQRAFAAIVEATEDELLSVTAVEENLLNPPSPLEEEGSLPASVSEENHSLSAPVSEGHPLLVSVPEKDQSLPASVSGKKQPQSASVAEESDSFSTPVSRHGARKNIQVASKTAATKPSTMTCTLKTQRNSCVASHSIVKKMHAVNGTFPSKSERKCNISSSLVANLVVGGVRKFKCKACGNMTLKKNSMLKHLDSCPRRQHSQDVSQHTKAAQHLFQQRSKVNASGRAQPVLSHSICEDFERQNNPAKVHSSPAGREDSSSDSESEIAVQRKKRRLNRVLDSSSSISSDEGNTAAEVLVKVKCKHCAFSLPKSNSDESKLRQHLLDAHRHLTKLSKCGHCSALYAAANAGWLRNHNRSQHPDKPEKAEPVPCAMFYNEEVEEACSSSQSLSSQQTTDGYSPSEDKENKAGSKGEGPEPSTSDSPDKTRRRFIPSQTTASRKTGKRLHLVSDGNDSDSSSDTDSNGEKRTRVALQNRSAAKRAKTSLHSQLAEDTESSFDDTDKDEDFVGEKQSDTSKQSRSRFITNKFKIIRSSRHPPNETLQTGSVKQSDDGSAAKPVTESAQPEVTGTVAGDDSATSGDGAEKENSHTGNHDAVTAAERTTTGIVVNGRSNASQEPTHYRYICDCGEQSNDKRHMRLHISKHIGYKGVRCLRCQQVFFTHEEVLTHSLAEHPNLELLKRTQKSPALELKLVTRLKRAEMKGGKQKVPVESRQPSVRSPSTLTTAAVEQRLAQMSSKVSVFVKQGVQCTHCDQKFDSLYDLKSHHEECHTQESSHIMQWRDVGTGGMYDMSGTCQVEGSCRLQYQHKYLCAFCGYRTSQRNMVLSHHQSEHKPHFQWIVMLRTSRFAKPSISSLSATHSEVTPSATDPSEVTRDENSPTPTSDSDSSLVGIHRDEQLSSDVKLSASCRPVVELVDFVLLRMRKEEVFRKWFKTSGIKAFDLYGLDKHKLRKFYRRSGVPRRFSD